MAIRSRFAAATRPRRDGDADERFNLMSAVGPTATRMHRLFAAGLAVPALALLATGPVTHAESPAGLVVGRLQHTGTLLPDGRVLVVGGFVDSGELGGSAELYDPATGSSTPTGSMEVARRGHSAVMLADGRVLVIGGSTGDAQLYAPEVWDPASGVFAPLTGVLPSDLATADAATLPDGRILIQGASVSYAPFDQALLLDADATSAQPVEPIPGAPVPLADGRILGIDTSSGTPVARIYDLDAGTSAVVGPPAGPVSGTVTRLIDGRVLFAGGTDANDRTSGVLQVFDPVSASFSVVGSLVRPRYAHTATLLADGRVLIAGGRTHQHRSGPEGKSWAIKSAEVVDPVSGSSHAVGLMTEPRMYASATLLPDGRVLVLGGAGRHDVELASAEMFDPATERFTPVAGPLRALAGDRPDRDLWLITTTSADGSPLEPALQELRRHDGATGQLVGSMGVEVSGCAWNGVRAAKHGLWLLAQWTREGCVAWLPFDGSAATVFHRRPMPFISAAAVLGDDLWFVGVRTNPEATEEPNPPGNLWHVTPSTAPRIAVRGVDGLAAAGGALWLGRFVGNAPSASGDADSVRIHRGERYDPATRSLAQLPVVVTAPNGQLAVHADGGLVLFEGRTLRDPRADARAADAVERLFVVRAATRSLISTGDVSLPAGRPHPDGPPLGDFRLLDRRVWGLTGPAVWSAPVEHPNRMRRVVTGCDGEPSSCYRFWLNDREAGGGRVPVGIWSIRYSGSGPSDVSPALDLLDPRSRSIRATIDQPFRGPDDAP